MVRHSYRHELRSALTFPLAASLAEGSFTGVVAAKNFGAGVVLMSVITAAPMFGNIMALVWSDLSMGRRKVPIVNALQAGVVLMIASVALTALLPKTLPIAGHEVPVAGCVFALQIVIARVLASGIITIRSQIWRANYPRQLRGQITSRIATVATTVLAATTFAGSYLLDVDSQSYVYIYPTAALIGVVGILQFRKIRVRREAVLRKREAQSQVYAPRPEGLSETDETNVLNYEQDQGGPRRVPRFVALFRDAFQLLRDDSDYRFYQWCQFLNGASFMMYGPMLLFMVSREMTDPTRDYLLATVVVQIIPMVTAVLFTQAWAPLFDRVHIVRFRVIQGFVSVAAQLGLWTGALVGIGDPETGLVVLGAAQFVVGVSNAAGNLAWNLGHNDFAPADQAARYMGVHVMLTGLRGAFAPFLGAWLYQLDWVGRNVFGVTTLMCVAGLIGFWRMGRRMPKRATPQHATVTARPRAA